MRYILITQVFINLWIAAALCPSSTIGYYASQRRSINLACNDYTPSLRGVIMFITRLEKRRGNHNNEKHSYR